MFTRKEKYLLFSLALIQFSHIVDFMILMPLGPQLMRVFSISPAQFGFLVSSYTFAAGVSGLIAARFIDRFDRKTTLLFFYIGFCLSTVACAFSPSYEFFLLARTLAGAFGGVLGSLVLAIVGDAIAPERRGTATGTVMMAFSLAEGVLPFDADFTKKQIYDAFTFDFELRELMSWNKTCAQLESEIAVAIDNKKEFAYETNFNHEPLYWVKRFKEAGHLVHLLFFCLESVELAIERVAIRFQNGGHFVPNDEVRARYYAGFENLSKHF